jgi:uncharacterized protein (DUF2252 family)
MHWTSQRERRALGQARRKQVGRHEHNQIDCKSRPVTALTLLERSMRGRVPELVRLKYGLMADSAIGYFRGAACVMAADLAQLPSTGILSQLCGDAHVRNLGAFAAPDGRLTFDINDFDETIRGPFEWDLKRMATSLILAGRAAGHKESAARRAAGAFVVRYVEQMREFSRMPHLEVGKFLVHRIDVAEPVLAALSKAERATPQHTLEQLTHPSSAKPDAPRHFKEAKPMLFRITGARAAAIVASLVPYRQMLEPQRQHLLSFYRPVDVAFKVVGTGSVGLRDYVIYLEGNGEGDPLFLQIKEETTSAYAPYLTDAHPPAHNGQRVAEGQRAMQIQTDPFLGWTHIGGRQFLVRQLNDHKASIDMGDLIGANLKAYGEVCGELLARGHARSGDPQVIAGYIGNGEAFAEALTEFGVLYANQTEKDWEQLKKSGKAKVKK